MEIAGRDGCKVEDLRASVKPPAGFNICKGKMTHWDIFYPWLWQQSWILLMKFQARDHNPSLRFNAKTETIRQALMARHSIFQPSLW